MASYRRICSYPPVELFIKELDNEMVGFIVAFELGRWPSVLTNDRFKIEGEGEIFFVDGRELIIKSHLEEIVIWLFRKSFRMSSQLKDLENFLGLLELLKELKVQKSDIGLLGEILFAYTQNLGRTEVQNWLANKNRSIDFEFNNKFWEIKTSHLTADQKIRAHLSYNQISLLCEGLILVFIDLGGSRYSASKEELVEYFNQLNLGESYKMICDCIDKFTFLTHFEFNIFEYIGPINLIQTDERVIGLNCKIQVESKDLKVWG